MEIGIDCSCVAKPERTGVARYCTALLRELPRVIEEGERVTLLYRFSRLKRRRWFERIDDPRFRLAMFQDPYLRFGPRRMDVVHGPDLRIPRFRATSMVSTVHDLSALELPEIAKESFRKRKREALADVARRATVILCISAFTEQLFLGRYPEAQGRTRVVPLGISDRFSPQDPERIATVRAGLGIAQRYVLFVGQISTRKNLRPLLDAFIRLHDKPRFRDVDLVLAGPVQTGGEEIVEAARSSTASERIRLPGFVGDDVLPALYAGAQAFCFTGKGEGFGLPILEAMACGCPVITARAGANVSTAGGAACLVDPDDSEDLEAQLEEALDGGAMRDRLMEHGFKRAEEFSWRVTARRTVEAYRDAARQGTVA